MKRWMRTFAAGCVRLYQKTLSFDHGPLKLFYPHGYCPYYPSCSEYTRQAILRHGVFKGMYLGMRRIIRCRPGCKGGVDHVPK